MNNHGPAAERAAGPATRRALVLRLLVRQEALPRDIAGFLHSARCPAMLDETRNGYRFAHRQLQQQFLQPQFSPVRIDV